MLFLDKIYRGFAVELQTRKSRLGKFAAKQPQPLPR